jgi:hypothetical protein
MTVTEKAYGIARSTMTVDVRIRQSPPTCESQSIRSACSAS